jgi:hypothetical protein
VCLRVSGFSGGVAVCCHGGVRTSVVVFGGVHVELLGVGTRALAGAGVEVHRPKELARRPPALAVGTGCAFGQVQPSTAGPSSMPNAISPTTQGCPVRRASRRPRNPTTRKGAECGGRFRAQGERHRPGPPPPADPPAVLSAVRKPTALRIDLDLDLDIGLLRGRSESCGDQACPRPARHGGAGRRSRATPCDQPARTRR